MEYDIWESITKSFDEIEKCLLDDFIEKMIDYFCEEYK